MGRSIETAETKVFKMNTKRIMKEKGISVFDLCKSLGNNRTYFARLTNPSLRVIVSIAKAIGCTPAELLEGLEGL